ncbi:hypothetical protein Daus18300_007952 [Diaporthe australafricana]|uniref:Uncharacterized protein n=1 Tax=Diaporthe australafricana TaxID=127596 RepID=A0ABR3WK08_9PEZI
MAPNNITHGARKRIDYRAGWSLNEPIVIDEVEEVSPAKVVKKSHIALDDMRKLREMNLAQSRGAKTSSATGRLSEDDEDAEETHTRVLKRARHNHNLASGYAMTLQEEETGGSFGANLSAMWREVDRQRDAAKQLEDAKEQAQQQAKRDQFLEAESRESHRRSRMASTLKLMQQDHDRRRQASVELQRAKEQERMDEEREREREAEAEKAKQRSIAEANLRALWQIRDEDDTRARRMGAGQLSERGRLRVQERREAQAREAARRG